MKKIRIEYFPSRCVGNGNCQAASPATFKLRGEKAELRQGVQKNNHFCLERGYSPDIIQAAESCPVNAIKVTNLETGEVLVSADVDEDSAKELVAEYDDLTEFVLDPAGYFLIRILPEEKMIEVGFCTMKNTLVLKVKGSKPIDIYHTILVQEKLPLRPEHCAYLGRELQKAYICLQKGLKYVQDDEL